MLQLMCRVAGPAVLLPLLKHLPEEAARSSHPKCSYIKQAVIVTQVVHQALLTFFCLPLLQ